MEAIGVPHWIKEHMVMIQQSDHVVKLFYSYSHEDGQHREFMEKSLALLKRDGLLKDWSDQEILPGRRISVETRSNMDHADIIVFLISPDFIASEECTKEWIYAKQLASNNQLLFRIPIILRDCAWKDFLEKDDLKALPEDGVPVVNFCKQDTAWQQVYEGIKAVVNELRSTFTAKPTFL
ncbi:MAG: toll/interleukin-1 receptor domain-containing protein, partial [Dehalococcoidia bacterium]|nr:toll/interleukin-1 receptor domain-containing protein [Dehalococcoidia bacterium]